MAGILLSSLTHATLAGTLYYRLGLHKPAPIVAELDLSMAPLVPMIPNQGGGHGANPAETWTLPKKGKTPVPQSAPVPETKEEVVEQENQEAPCPDCPQNQGEGQYISAEQASRKPRWIKNFITSQDYPLVARQQGKVGQVVLAVLIDAEGRVRDARLLQGGYEALNEVALRKVREAVFTPAYNDDNRPVSCKVMLPIRFELR